MSIPRNNVRKEEVLKRDNKRWVQFWRNMMCERRKEREREREGETERETGRGRERERDKEGERDKPGLTYCMLKEKYK